MDTQFAKIVTDAYGKDHILIDGTLVSLNAPIDKNNELVDVIVSGLRRPSGDTAQSAGGTSA